MPVSATCCFFLCKTRTVGFFLLLTMLFFPLEAQVQSMRTGGVWQFYENNPCQTHGADQLAAMSSAPPPGEPHPLITETHTAEKRIGLTLSGGGAKGFAHIGVLHVIDSLGIPIDYVSGTSMGSVIGGMYAAGYSAAEIEEIALRIDWQNIFSRRTDLAYTHPRKRERYGRYIIELPIEEGRFVIPTGAIEGQQLWNTLSELFFHVRDISDFSQLPIPFTCVATDLGTGEAVIMNSGDIVTAIRASMAIPSVFTTVERNDRKLIDGGVVMNFPVSVARQMGADKVIGVNVSQGLREVSQLHTPVDVLYQMGFFLDAHSFAENRKLTDVYIAPDLDDFTVTSFQDVALIIEQGKQQARKQLSQLADLIPQTHSDHDHANAFPGIRAQNQFVIDSIALEGLENIRSWFVHNVLSLEKGDTVTLERINRLVNRLYATNYFNRINYSFHSNDDTSSGTLVFHFDEKPFGRMAAAIHYSSFTGVGLIGSLTTSKFFFYNTSAYVDVLVGEKPALRAGLDIYTSDRQNTWFNLESTLQHIVFPVYEDFRSVGEYRQTYIRNEGSLMRMTGLNSYLSLGAARYFQSLSPSMRTESTVRGNARANEVFFRWHQNSLNRHAFPQSGIKFELGSTYFFNQKPSLRFSTNTGERSSELSELGIEIDNYFQLTFNWESYIRVSPTLSSFNRLQAGYNFNYNQSFINMFNLGGTYPFLKNQIAFAGLNEYEIMSKAILTAATGWQYNVWDEFLITPLINAAIFDFDLEALDQFSHENFILGGALNIGYLSAVGPLEVTLSFSPKTSKLLAYVNLGWTF